MKREEITYSEALAEIERILEKIDSDEADIDTLGADVKRAAELVGICKKKLRKAEEDVEKALED